mmetsp:Transcript_19619/g.47349  ORF Transcript_19619/g.47349 Transcript_19619/m.47349 type:complete len:470 (-) Transcript_19619:65-1474(-)
MVMSRISTCLWWLCIGTCIAIATAQQGASPATAPSNFAFPTFSERDPDDCVFVVTEQYGGFICGPEAEAYRPTPFPTSRPTNAPTVVQPTVAPTPATTPAVVAPTVAAPVVAAPTTAPVQQETNTNTNSTAVTPPAPTPAPQLPTFQPTKNPTAQPTLAPTPRPSPAPTPAPTFRQIPVSEADPDITDSPTPLPTPSPVVPTAAPTTKASPAPTSTGGDDNSSETGSAGNAGASNSNIEDAFTSTLPRVTIDIMADYHESEINLDGLKTYFQSFIESILMSMSIDVTNIDGDNDPQNGNEFPVAAGRAPTYIDLQSITSFDVVIVAPTLTNTNETMTNPDDLPTTVPLAILLDGTAVFSLVKISSFFLQEPLKEALADYFSLSSTNDVEVAIMEEGGLKDASITNVRVGDLEVALDGTSSENNGVTGDGNGSSMDPSKNAKTSSGSSVSIATFGTTIMATTIVLAIFTM